MSNAEVANTNTAANLAFPAHPSPQTASSRREAQKGRGRYDVLGPPSQSPCCTRQSSARPSPSHAPPCYLGTAAAARCARPRRAAVK